MTDLVERLREHAEAWGVSAATPDDEVLNETRMARECARAADEIERLRARVAELHEALEYFGNHGQLCSVHDEGECCCGYRAALMKDSSPPTNTPERG